MKVTISLDFDALKDDIRVALENRLADLNYENDVIDSLLESFDSNIDGGFMDATFEIEMNKDETEITSCMLIGG